MKALIRPVFFFRFFFAATSTPPNTSSPEVRSAERAARTARLLPSPATLFPGVRCRQDPLTPSTALPPPARQNPSILTDDLIRPAPDRACSPPCRPPYPFFLFGKFRLYFFALFFFALFLVRGPQSGTSCSALKTETRLKRLEHCADVGVY